jgi:hypothetical protein
LNEIIELHWQNDWFHSMGTVKWEKSFSGKNEKRWNNGIHIKTVYITQNYFSVKE